MGKRAGVELNQPAADVAALAVDDRVPASHEAVQVDGDPLVRPVPASAGKVGGGLAVEPGEREYVVRLEAPKAAAPADPQEVLETRPVVPAPAGELIRVHQPLI